MKLAELRSIRAITSRAALHKAMFYVRTAAGQDTPQTYETAQPVWFALCTCVEPDLKLLYADGVTKRWLKTNGPMLGGIFRLIPGKVMVTHETPVP